MEGVARLCWKTAPPRIALGVADSLQTIVGWRDALDRCGLFGNPVLRCCSLALGVDFLSRIARTAQKLKVLKVPDACRMFRKSRGNPPARPVRLPLF